MTPWLTWEPQTWSRSSYWESDAMGLCKGNRGNLMQHWVLCEVLHRLGQQDFKHLSLSCTHSMAPCSMPERQADEDGHRCRRTFNEARMRAPADRTSEF